MNSFKVFPSDFYILDKHHRKCRSNGGKDDDRNLILIPRIKHKMWHYLFQNKTTKQICNDLNTIWCDPNMLIESYPH